MNEVAVMAVMATLLLAVAVYYTRSAVRTLRRTGLLFEMLPDERRFLRHQAWRRLVNSGVMLVLMGLLIGAYASGMAKKADEIGDARERGAVEGKKAPLTDEQRQFVRVFGAYVIVLLLVLGVVVLLAGIDLWATRRYAIQKLRQINIERRAMMDRQMARWRAERDGRSE